MTKEEAIKVLKRLLPVNHIDDVHKAIDLAIESLSAEPSGDLISREEAIDVVCNIKRTDNWQGAVIGLLSALPSADAVSREEYNKLLNDSIWQSKHIGKILEYQTEVADRPKGEWIADEHRNEIECSVCGERHSYGSEPIDEKFYPPFCQWCGADMRGDE